MTIAELTDEQIDALEAGRDVDWMVAVAVGIADEIPPSHVKSGPRIIADDRSDLFCPSKDWKDAMFAAEKFGLFKRGLSLTQDHPEEVGEDHEWSVFDDGLFLSDDVNESGIIASACTGQLAICKAILKLARSK